MFKTETDSLSIKKLSPIRKETPVTLNKLNSAKSPRVSSEDANPKKTGKLVPTDFSNSNKPLRVKLDYINPTPSKSTHKYQCPTRLKTTKAAQSMQLKESQVKSNNPATLQLPLDAINLPH